MSADEVITEKDLFARVMNRKRAGRFESVQAYIAQQVAAAEIRGVREGFENARLAFRTEEPMKGVPGMLLKLPLTDCWLYDNAEDYLSKRKE